MFKYKIVCTNKQIRPALFCLIFSIADSGCVPRIRRKPYLAAITERSAFFLLHSLFTTLYPSPPPYISSNLSPSSLCASIPMDAYMQRCTWLSVLHSWVSKACSICACATPTHVQMTDSREREDHNVVFCLEPFFGSSIHQNIIHFIMLFNVIIFCYFIKSEEHWTSGLMY